MSNWIARAANTPNKTMAVLPQVIAAAQLATGLTVSLRSLFQLGKVKGKAKLNKVVPISPEMSVPTAGMCPTSKPLETKEPIHIKIAQNITNVHTDW